MSLLAIDSRRNGARNSQRLREKMSRAYMNTDAVIWTGTPPVKWHNLYKEEEERTRERQTDRERERERERNCQLSQLRAAVCRAMIYTRCSRRLFTTYVTWDDKSSLAGSPLCVTRAHKLHSDGQILSHMAARYTFPPSPIIFIYIFYIHFALVSPGILRLLLALLLVLFLPLLILELKEIKVKTEYLPSEN